MWDLVKKYWDLLSGSLMGLGLSIMAHSDSEKVRLIYSVIILVLVCMGLFRFIRQSIESERKRKIKREHNLLDNMVDNQIVVKAIRLAQDPTKEGEKIGKLFKEIIGGKQSIMKNFMKKVKELFDKFKGYLLTFLLAALTVLESYGGYINGLCGGALQINGVEIVPLATLFFTAVVGIISNGYTKEQMTKIKALFSKSSTTELVLAEIKKSYKDNSTKLSQFNKLLATKETELESLQSEHETAKNTFQAKKEMYNMIPQLASEEDVILAANEVSDIEIKINNKMVEIEETKATIANLKTTINALKSQL